MLKPRIFKSKGSLMLSSILLVASLFSCTKKDLQEQSIQAEQSTVPLSTATVSSTGLLYEEFCEGTTLFPTAHAIENCATDWTLSYVNNPVFKGSKSARFEIRNDQTLVGSGKKIRSEVTTVKGTEDTRFTKEMWYSYALYFPSTGMEYDATRDCISQWYEDGSDETTIRTEKDKVYLEVTPPSGSSTLKKYDLFNPSLSTSGASFSSFVSIPKDTWHEFVFHIIHSTGSDGLIEVWRDGVKIHNIVGRNMHLQYPKWKIGLYKASFLDKSSERYSRVLFIDNVRVGNSSASYAAMTSGATTTTPTTTPTDTTTVTPTPTPTTSSSQQVVSYTLVNASTEKDVMTITNGATINLSALGITKANIRANTNPSTVGSVKFALSGAKSYSYTDDAAPYALLGDDGNGNYYYGNYLLSNSGTYTLKSTPYTNSNGGGTAGTAYSISFTIVK
jgi:hypothetical protein